MTRRERWGFTWFVLAACFTTGTINWAINGARGQQPLPQTHDRPPQIKMRGDYDAFYFENGNTWYIRPGTINAIWAIPADKYDEMGGIKTRVYGQSYTINLPYDVTDILEQLYEADIEILERLKRELRESRNEETNSD